MADKEKFTGSKDGYTEGETFRIGAGVIDKVVAGADVFLALKTMPRIGAEQQYG
jgi:hypothetical protein